MATQALALLEQLEALVARFQEAAAADDDGAAVQLVADVRQCTSRLTALPKGSKLGEEDRARAAR